MVSGSVDDLVASPDGEKALSAVAVPLFWEARVSGVLAVHSPFPNAFQESDRVLLETLSAQIASAMERIRLFESVEQEQRRLAAVLNAAADAILMLDPERRLLLANPAALQLFQGVEIRTGARLPAEHGFDPLLALLERAAVRGRQTQGEVDWPDKRTFVVQATPLEDGGLVAVLHDVSHFKDLDRVKNEFIATASHDLKSPITAILGYGELLGNAGPLNERQAEFAVRMRKAATQMHDLVLNLLELARIDLGMDLKLDTCDVLDLLTGATDELRTQASTKHQTLALIPLGGRVRIQGDPTRLRHVLRNLIGNAVKFTPEAGQITISVEASGDLAHIRIEDTGLGIAQADLPYIFDRFYRAQSEPARDIEGSGLGLAIVKSIVELHDGRLAVESEVGRGSCFTVSLPMVRNT
jgi:two-component system phosphate regulon sensor histidine kinase PhoR